MEEMDFGAHDRLHKVAQLFAAPIVATNVRPTDQKLLSGFCRQGETIPKLPHPRKGARAG